VKNGCSSSKKVRKNRRSSYIIRDCNIRPSNIKESRGKDINLTKKRPLLIHIFIIMFRVVMRLLLQKILVSLLSTVHNIFAFYTTKMRNGNLLRKTGSRARPIEEKKFKMRENDNNKRKLLMHMFKAWSSLTEYNILLSRLQGLH